MPSADQVFTPTSPPTVTYVDRHWNGRRLEDLLRLGLATKGQLVSLAGPSKSGKTVLVERVAKDYLIPISGGGIRSSSDLWQRVMAWVNAPTSITSTSTYQGGSKATASAEVGAKLPVVEGKTGGSAEQNSSVMQAVTSTQSPDLVEKVRRELAESEFVLFIDDFHYIDRPAQAEIAQQLKYLASAGVKLVVASVPFRGDDVVRSNAELQGRLLRVDTPNWTPAEIQAIGRNGFEKLGLSVSESQIKQLQTEACESPQLMQSICLALARAMMLAGKTVTSKADINDALTFAALTVDFRNLTKALDQGAKTRGTERKVYTMLDGTSGDVYRVVLKALSSDPPRLNFSYPQLMERVAEICQGDQPTGSSVAGTCEQLKKLAEAVVGQSSPGEVDWDSSLQMFDFPNPFFLYFLRWSGLLKEPQYRTLN